MSQENVEVVKALFDAWSHRDPAAAADLIDPNVEVDFRQVTVVQGAASGHDGLQRILSEWFEAYRVVDFFPQNFIDAGDHVIVWFRVAAVGRESGASVDQMLAAMYTLANGRLTGFRGYETLAAATAAAKI